jgi:hypothetical protein
MLKFTTTSGLVAGAAVLGLSFAAFFTSPSPQAQAEPQIASVLDEPLAKTDRLPVRIEGAACASRGWPYYDQGCRFDLRTPAKETPTVRVIALR